MALNKSFIEKIKKGYADATKERRLIISLSNEILHEAKRSIFSIHRGDLITASTILGSLDKKIEKLQNDFGYHRLSEEGAYTAGIEEYVEAKLFYLAATDQTITKIAKIKISNDSYLGGLSDVTGELVRLATNSAASGNFDKVKTCQKLINEIMGEMVAMDLTGYLRTKYDQAKSNLRKIEQMAYEIKLSNLRK